MTPTLIAELRNCAEAADRLHAYFLGERLRDIAHDLETMTLLPVAALTPPPRGRPTLRVITGSTVANT
jgi:hypothetical protein